MLKTNSEVIRFSLIISWVAIACFTIAGASFASPPHDKWNWDTISQMVTRNQALENAFAVFLTADTIVLGAVVVSMIYRFEDAGLAGQNFTLQRFVIVSCFSIAMVAMIGIGIASLAVDDDVHTAFAGVAFTLLWIGTTLLAYVHKNVQKYPVVAALSVFVGGISMLVLAMYSTSEHAHERVQDNEAYFCEYILVTTMHILLYTLANLKIEQKYSIHLMLQHGPIASDKQKKTLIL